MALTGPFISWYFFKLSSNNWIGVGLVSAVPYIFLIFSTVLFGRLSDIFGSKNLVLVSLSAYSLSFIIYFIIGENAELFFFIYIGFNLIISAFIPSFNRLVSFYEDEDRAKKFGKLAMMASMGFLLGSVISSLFIDEIGLRNFFPLASVISFITIILTFKLTEVAKKSINSDLYQETQIKDFYDSFLFIKSIFIILVLVFITQLASSLYSGGLFSIFIEKELNLPISLVALGNAVATFLGIITCYLIGKISKFTGMKILFLIALVFYAAIPLMTYIFSNIPIVVFFLYCIPLYSVFFVLAPVFISLNSRENHRGKAMGLYTSFQYIGLSLGSIGGAIFASINGKVSPNMLISFLIGLIGFLIVLFFFKDTSIEKIV